MSSTTAQISVSALKLERCDVLLNLASEVTWRLVSNPGSPN